MRILNSQIVERVFVKLRVKFELRKTAKVGCGRAKTAFFDDPESTGIGRFEVVRVPLAVLILKR
jgi:hypothetical protein